MIHKLQQARINLNRAYYKRQTHRAIDECDNLIEMVIHRRQQAEHNRNLH